SLSSVRVDDLSEQNQQRAAPYPESHVGEGVFVVRLDEPRVNPVATLYQATGGVGSALGQYEAVDALVEGEQTDLVAASGGYVGQHQARIQGVIELGQIIDDGRHQAPAIEHEQNVLIALQLVLSRRQLLAAR